MVMVGHERRAAPAACRTMVVSFSYFNVLSNLQRRYVFISSHRWPLWLADCIPASFSVDRWGGAVLRSVEVMCVKIRE